MGLQAQHAGLSAYRILFAALPGITLTAQDLWVLVFCAAGK